MSEAKNEASELMPLLADFHDNSIFQGDDSFDDPDGSEWVLGVDAWGRVFVVEPPNLPDGFLDSKNAEEIGLPYELVDTKPGLYKATMAFRVHYYGEYGNDEEWLFEPTKLERIDS